MSPALYELFVRAIGIVMQLQAQAGDICPNTASVAIYDSDSVQAWTDHKDVAITRGMMRKASTKDELAFVLAHELAHGCLARTSRPNTESAADALGYEMMKKAGYDTAGAESILLKTDKGLLALSLTHPSNKARIKKLKELSNGAS